MQELLRLTTTFMSTRPRVGTGWDSLGESGEKGLPGECQLASCVLQRFNNFYEGNHWQPLQPVGDGTAHAQLILRLNR